MPRCISVHKDLAERAIRELRKKNLIDEGYLIAKVGDRVLIPVLEASHEIELSFGREQAFECTLQPRNRAPSAVKMPSLDVLGEAVILREKALMYRSLQEVIDSVRQVYPRVRAIWVKEETADVYRRPVLRLLWGEEVRDVVVKEYKIKIKITLGDVYYNPRLAEEHRRVAKLVKGGEVIVDAFSGVGCFSLHVASSALSLVIANDINPAAYDLLVENISMNRKGLRGTIIPLNLDSAELPSVLSEGRADRVIADLPLKSLDYVEVYEKLLKPGGVLHLYMHSSSVEDAKISAAERLRGWFISGCREVLEYSPRTGIFRCDIRKPNNI